MRARIIFSILFILSVIPASMSYSGQIMGKANTYKDPTTGMEFVFVKGGCYQMGDTFGDGYDLIERPVHEVCVDDFCMGKYAVTQGEWKAMMGNNPSLFKKCGHNCPVERVSWNEVQAFISKLNSKGESNKYRLPTEAEWEYAARSGGRQEKYAGSNDIDRVAWYWKNDKGQTHPVGHKQPNGLGLYDMNGNVYQWCQDWYDADYYKDSPRNNPKGPASGNEMYIFGRVARGGSWRNDARTVRTSMRMYGPDGGYDFIGFRLVRTP